MIRNYLNNVFDSSKREPLLPSSGNNNHNIYENTEDSEVAAVVNNDQYNH